jgi:Ca2+-transporting ATPase
MNFGSDLFLAVGLGYGVAAGGLMARPPRRADEPVLGRPLLVWLVAVGLVMGTVTLAVISRGSHNFGLVVGRTMGITTFALCHVAFAVATKDERRSMFNLDTINDKPLMIASAAAVGIIILTVTFGPFQRLLNTASLDLGQWLVCIGCALSIVVVSELRKALIRRPIDELPRAAV